MSSTAWKRLAATVEEPNRGTYQERRRGFLASFVDVRRAAGLELGAFDLPTVPPEHGNCAIADVRTEIDLSDRFGNPIDEICRVDHIYDPARPLHLQVDRQFDYVILCHVIEHIPNVIGFLRDVQRILREGGVLFLAVPDKRETPDRSRPSTPLARLVERDATNATAPSMSEIAEFALAWRSDAQAAYNQSLRRFFDGIQREMEHGDPDVHCNVWQDEDLFEQLREFIRGDLLPGLELIGTHPTEAPFNEFFVALVNTGSPGDAEETAPEADVPIPVWRACPFCAHARFRRFGGSTAAPEEASSHEAASAWLTCTHCDLTARSTLGGEGRAQPVPQGAETLGAIALAAGLDRMRHSGRLCVASRAPEADAAILRDERGWSVEAWPVPGSNEAATPDAAAYQADPTLPAVDAVFLMDALERSTAPLALLLDARDRLAPDGRLFLVVPNRRGPDAAIASDCRLLPTAPVLHVLLRRLGLVTEQIHGLGAAPEMPPSLTLLAGDEDACEALVSTGGPTEPGAIVLVARLAPGTPDIGEPDLERLRRVAEHAELPRQCVAIED